MRPSGATAIDSGAGGYGNDTGTTGGNLAYYRTPAGVEVDFIWTGPDHAVGIEVKPSGRWRRADGAALADLHARKVIRKTFAVYGGDHPLQDGPVRVLPLRDFLEDLPRILR